MALFKKRSVNASAEAEETVENANKAGKNLTKLITHFLEEN